MPNLLKKSIYILLLCLFSYLAQANKTDSLTALLSTSDKNKICTIIKEIGIEYINSNLDSAFIYLDSALILAKENNLQKEVPFILRSLGKAYLYISEITKGIEYTLQAVEEFKKINDRYNLAVTYNNLGIFYSYQGNNDSSIIVHRKALKVFKTIKDTIEIIETLNNIGTAYYYKADYDSTLLILNKALKNCNRIDNNKTIGAVYNNLGLLHHTTGQLDIAIENFVNALKYFEQTDDTRAVNLIYNNIGTIYVELGFNKKALKYFKRKADECLRQNDIPEYLYAYSNIGLCYVNLAKNDSTLYDSALFIFEKAAKMVKPIQNDRLKGLIYKNLSDSYIIAERNDDALRYLKMAVKHRIADNDKYGLAMTYNSIGNAYTGKKDFTNALYYLSKCDKIAEEIRAYRVMIQARLSIADLYTLKGNYKMATDYYQSYIVLNDSIINESVQNKMSDLETKYQTEKKEHKIKLQNTELAKQKEQLAREKAESEKKAAQRNIVIVGLGLMIVLAVVIFRSYKQKKRANDIINEKNIILEQANEEITAQRDKIEAQRDEIEAQRDTLQTQKDQIEEIHLEVTQSIQYAKLIQSSVLPNSELLENKFNNYFVLFKPRDFVSGDFYWWTNIEGQTIITAADCTGHGVPGAFMSLLGISFLREIVVKEYITHPGLILKKLRKEVVNTLKQKGVSGEQKDGMDMSLISINHETNTLQFAGANNPLYLIRDNELHEYKGDKMPIAIYEKMDKFTTHEIQLQKGDNIYMFSDGYADQFGGLKGKKFKYKPFKQLLIDNSKKPMAEQKEILDKTFEDWKGNIEQIDDVIIVGIEI